MKIIYFNLIIVIQFFNLKELNIFMFLLLIFSYIYLKYGMIYKFYLLIY